MSSENAAVAQTVRADERDAAADVLHEQARLADLFTSIPGCQKLFMDTFEACREPKTPAELDEFMGRILAVNRSVFGPVELRSAMEKHGGLVYQPSESEQEARSRLLADGSIDENEPVEVDEEGYLVFKVPQQGLWALSEAGCLYLDSDPLGAYADELFEREEHYLGVYAALLGAVAQGPQERQALADLVDPMPECQQPRVYVGHFLGEMEHAAAMTWTDKWEITERGSALLQRLEDAVAERKAGE